MKANAVLWDLVPELGIEGLPKGSRQALEYGLEQGTIKQEEIDRAQEEYIEHVLLDQESKTSLKAALEQGASIEREIDYDQGKYSFLKQNRSII